MYEGHAQTYIDASPEVVWNYATNTENLSRFLTHIRRVETVSERTHYWTLNGPLGIPIIWKTLTLEKHEGSCWNWLSIEGMIDAKGTFKFRREGEGTVVSLSLTYRAYGGALDDIFANSFTNLNEVIAKDLDKLAFQIERNGLQNGSAHSNRVQV
jgi:uncharacterized membrane protein